MFPGKFSDDLLTSFLNHLKDRLELAVVIVWVRNYFIT